MTKVKAAILLACAAALALAGCVAQPNHLISGTVVDRATGAPIAGARVHEGQYAKELSAGAVSDGSGAFAYYSYPEEHNIIVEAAGYAKWTGTVGINGKDAELTIELGKE